MFTLQKEQAKIHKFGKRTYYVFPKPPTHSNTVNRPTKYAKEGELKAYTGRGANGSAKLLPEVHPAVHKLMTALLDYGNELGDYSLQSAVVQNGWRPLDDPSQGVHYLENIKMVIANPQFGFSDLTFPTALEAEAEGFLGERDNPHWKVFVEHLSMPRGPANFWTRFPSTTCRGAVLIRTPQEWCSI